MMGKEFQSVKCNLMQITRKWIKINASYTLEGTVLENVEKFKYLGITITRNDITTLDMIKTHLDRNSDTSKTIVVFHFPCHKKRISRLVLLFFLVYSFCIGRCCNWLTCELYFKPMDYFNNHQIVLDLKFLGRIKFGFAFTLQCVIFIVLVSDVVVMKYVFKKPGVLHRNH